MYMYITNTIAMHNHFPSQPWTDLHNTCAALKQYFRRLAEPLVPSHLYPAFMEAAQLEVRINVPTSYSSQCV